MSARIAVLAGVCLLGTIGSGCAAGRTTPSPPPSPAPSASAAGPPPSRPPAGSRVDSGEPSRVCLAFTAAVYSWDTTGDTGPRDAYRRAAPYLTGALAAQLRDAGNDPRWATWDTHQARLDTRLLAYTDAEQPPDSSIEAYRAVRVAATPVGTDGWRGATQHHIVFCTLHRTGGWRVASFQIRPAVP